MNDKNFNRDLLPGSVLFLLPVNGISGGLFVVYRYAQHLQNQGVNVTCAFSSTISGKDIQSFPGVNFRTAYLDDLVANGETFDLTVATWWKTFYEMFAVQAKHRLYLCQSDERRFYSEDDSLNRNLVEYTYAQQTVPIIVIAKWMVEWMRKEFGCNVAYCPNGLDTELFNTSRRSERPAGARVRILVEGPASIPFKGVGESFKILEGIENIEKWLVTSDGQLRAEWKPNKVFSKVPLEKMAEIYSSCDILLKMSKVESFCYPPLEMMACGGTAIIRQVTGIEEYARHGKNCLILYNDDIDSAREAVRLLVNDSQYRKMLSLSGVQDAKELSWEIRLPAFIKEIASLASREVDSKHLDTGIFSLYFRREQNLRLQEVESSLAYRVGLRITKLPRRLFHRLRTMSGFRIFLSK